MRTPHHPLPITREYVEAHFDAHNTADGMTQAVAEALIEERFRVCQLIAKVNRPLAERYEVNSHLFDLLHYVLTGATEVEE